MPLALPGTLIMLLAQTAALCGSATVPPAPLRPEAAIVQRDEAFVIVSAAEAVPEAMPIPAAIGPASLRLGRAVHIDRDLLVVGTRRAAGGVR